jgi:hypothetical protein
MKPKKHAVKPLESVQEQESEGKCVVCWVGDRCVVLLPCKHLALCVGCSELLKQNESDCPMCRGPVTEHMVLFQV